MKTTHVPRITAGYWVALILASIFGANTGDYFSDDVGLGHITGLPFLLVAFALVLVSEAFDKRRHYAWYWLAIIIVRTAATNLGDIFHDFHISFLISIPCVGIALFGLLLLWKKVSANSLAASSSAGRQTAMVLPTNSFYWLAMLLAGTLGTVVGDYFSYPLGLGNLYASLVLSATLAGMFCVRGLMANLFYFWLIVVMIRSAGTAAGDFFAHHVFGLPLSVVITGCIFIAFLLLFKEKPFSENE